jgi:putative phosphoesterase
MKVGVLSDIHANLAGLQRALDLLDDCDEVLCAGDLLYEYRFSNGVLALLERRGVRAITGNHDRTILHTPSYPLRSAPATDPRWLRYLGEVPDRLSLTLSGTRLFMVHGAPWDEPGRIRATYVFPHDEPRLRRLQASDADVVILGHTHQPIARWVGNVLVINPGSCGDPRPPVTEYHCARLDLDSRTAELVPFSL